MIQFFVLYVAQQKLSSLTRYLQFFVSLASHFRKSQRAARKNQQKIHKVDETHFFVILNYFQKGKKSLWSALAIFFLSNIFPKYFKMMKKFFQQFPEASSAPENSKCSKTLHIPQSLSPSALTLKKASLKLFSVEISLEVVFVQSTYFRLTVHKHLSRKL